jgi:hypothetical protein
MLLQTAWSKAIIEKLTVPHLANNSPYFMEVETSLPSAKEPATWPYAEPDQSSPHPMSLHETKEIYNLIVTSAGTYP